MNLSLNLKKILNLKKKNYIEAQGEENELKKLLNSLSLFKKNKKDN